MLLEQHRRAGQYAPTAAVASQDHDHAVQEWVVGSEFFCLRRVEYTISYGIGLLLRRFYRS